MLLNILVIYLKEMREVLRDRKTLIFMVLMPTLIVPVLMNLMISFVMRVEKKARTETLTYAIFGAEFLPEIAVPGQFSTHLLQSPQRGLFIGSPISNPASVSTVANRTAAPYSSVISSADFPIQPNPAHLATVLCGSGIVKVL